jgi:hypothetical protein
VAFLGIRESKEQPIREVSKRGIKEYLTLEISRKEFHIQKNGNRE